MVWWCPDLIYQAILTGQKSIYEISLSHDKSIILCFLHPLVMSLIIWSIRVFILGLAPILKMSHSTVACFGHLHLIWFIFSCIARYIHMLTMSVPISEFILRLTIILFSFAPLVFITVCDLSLGWNVEHKASDETSLYYSKTFFINLCIVFFCCR